MSDGDLGSLSLTEIFRMEAEEKCAQLDELLLQLEKRPGDRQIIDQLMRAAHSLKGAARIINLQGIMELAHAMEDVFSAAGRGECAIDRRGFDLLLEATDRLRALGLAVQDEDCGQPPDPSLQTLIDTVRDLVHTPAAEPLAATLLRRATQGPLLQWARKNREPRRKRRSRHRLKRKRQNPRERSICGLTLNAWGVSWGLLASSMSPAAALLT